MSSRLGRLASAALAMSMLTTAFPVSAHWYSASAMKPILRQQHKLAREVVNHPVSLVLAMAQQTLTTVTQSSSASSTNQAFSSSSSSATASKTSNLTPTPVSLPDGRLTITQEGLAPHDFVVQNDRNKIFLRFKATSNNVDNLITSLRFALADSGSLNNAKNYTLWVDSNGDKGVDSIIQTNVSPVSGRIIFNMIKNGGYVIPANQTVYFEVHADISSVQTNGATLQIQFAKTDAQYVEAERLADGNPLTGIQTDGICTVIDCHIVFTTISPAMEYTIVPQGNLFVTKSTTLVSSHQLLGGTLSDEILRLQLHAQYEYIDVTNLVFTAEGTDANSFASDIDRLDLYQVGASTPFATATVGSCGVNAVPANSMCAKMQNRELLVSKDADSTISVRALVRSDVNGAVSGHRFSLTINPTSSVSPISARGLFSSNILLRNNGNNVADGEVFIGTAVAGADQKISGKLNDIVLSKIVSITNYDPHANGTPIPTGTQKAIGQFKFSAADNQNTKNGPNKWTLNGLIFSVNATNVLLGSGSIKMYNKADPTTSVPCSSNGQFSGVFLVTCANLIASGINTQIDTGTDSIFVLQANVVNPKISVSSTSTLQVSLTNFSDINATSFDASNSHLLWVDEDNVSSAPFLWLEHQETSVNSTSYNS